MKKKLLSILIAAAMVLGLAACGSSNAASTAASAATSAKSEAAAAATEAKSEAPAAAAEAKSEAPAAEAPAATEAPAEAPAASEGVELIVFAAASMTETLDQIAELYKEVAPNVTLTYNFDSSGTLKTQIQEGADCDIFISAAQKQMNQIDAAKDAEGGNEEGLDFVLQGTRVDLLENKVALAVPDGNPKNINSYDDLVAGLKDGSVFLAMGNADVPVGQYTQKIFDYYGLVEDDLAKAGSVTYGSNVKEVTSQVSEATVDAGIIYQTDAFSAGLTIVDTATAEMCGQVIYPAAVLNITKNEAAAKAFLDYLSTDEASAVFEAVGFTPVK